MLFLEGTVHLDSYTLNTPLRTEMLCPRQPVLDLFDSAGKRASFKCHQFEVTCDEEVHMNVRREFDWKA